METFLNDNYSVLLIMKHNETVIIDKHVVPLLQSEICGLTGFSKVKIISIIKTLIDNGYLTKEAKGRYIITEKGNTVLDGIRKLSNNLDK